MKWVQVIFALSCLSCGPGGFPQEQAAAQRDAIVGGTLDPNDPAVVAILEPFNTGWWEFCTGTLIAPRTVLTAAHCVSDFPAGAVIGIGPDANAPVLSVQVAEAIGDPDYNGHVHDFAVLHLAKAVTSVDPLPLNETALSADQVGLSVRHVGFGITSGSENSSDGLKREVTYAIRSVQTYTFESGASGKQTCSGDSGGPALVVLPGSTQEVVAGVVSYGDQYCTQEGYDGRVDTGLTWIRSTMAAWETPTCAAGDRCLAGCTPVDQDCECADDGECGANCQTPENDPDCPANCGANGICISEGCGQPDPDCLQTGQNCVATTQCVSRRCITSEQHASSYCTQTCTADTDCPDAMACSNGLCEFALKPEKQLGDECTQGTDYCADAICTGPIGGLTRCVHACNSAANCATGEGCEGGADSQRYCRPPNLSFTREVTPPATPDDVETPKKGCSTAGAGAWWAVSLLLCRRRGRTSKES